MPPQGLKEARRFCPYCSGEYAEGYLWLHKRDFCPLRPGRREQINAEVMGLQATGLQIVPQSDVLHGGKGKGMVAPAVPLTTAKAVFPTNNKFSNIIPINLTEEYNNMVKVMQKKKEEEVEIGEEYQCGGCNTTFHGKKEPKHCPECGIEFA